MGMKGPLVSPVQHDGVIVIDGVIVGIVVSEINYASFQIMAWINTHIKKSTGIQLLKKHDVDKRKCIKIICICHCMEQPGGQKWISYTSPHIWTPIMMTSSNRNFFRVTGPLCGEITGPGEFPTQRPVTRSFDVSLICVWINGWVNNREAGDLRRHRSH